MGFNIDIWMKKYTERLRDLFEDRLEFIGLQGSYGRGEAMSGSDIDVVVILDQAEPEDLRAYGSMLDTLPERDRVCGFISGRQELLNWEPSDLFQFYYDTVSVYGSIDYLLPLIDNKVVCRTIQIGACNIYHMCGHNIVHEKDADILRGLYKSAGFTVQAVYYDQTGNYIRKKTKLIPVLEAKERDILQAGIAIVEQPDLAAVEFDRLSGLLFHWAAGLILEYGYK